MTYEVSYDAGTTALAGAFAGMFVFMLIIGLAVAAFSVVVMWKIFKKAGKEGWIALIPFYNLYTFFEITWGNGWLFLLVLLAIIPIVGSIAVCVIMIITMVKLAKAFGKSNGFAVGLVFLSLIFEAILAFDNSEYVGVNGVRAQEPTQTSVNPVEQPSVETPTVDQPKESEPNNEETTNENNNF